MGDDNIFSVSDSYVSLFTEEAISKFLMHLGMNFTSEDKSEAKGQLRSLFDVSFLKRGFRYEPLLDRYVAPLSLDTILETPYWTKDGSQVNTIVEDNVDNSLLELALHDPETFDTWSPQIVTAFSREYDKHPKCTSRRILVALSATIETNY
jgi:hypothetical protein